MATEQDLSSSAPFQELVQFGKDTFGNSYAHNEVQFYNWAIKQSYLSDEERTYLNILKQKLATTRNSPGTLNLKQMQAQTIFGGGSQSLGTRIDPGTSEINPVVVNSKEEIYQRNNHHAIRSIDKKAGLYKDSDNVYYFVLEPKKKANPYKNAGLPSGSTYNSTLLTTNPTPDPPKPTGGTISFPKAKVAKHKDDTLFNSQDYQSGFAAVIQDISMSLVYAGDDLLTNFNYESIDSIPDINIDIKIEGDQYLNSRDVLQYGLGDNFLSSLLDQSTSSEEMEKANAIVTYLETVIGPNASYYTMLEYFGSFATDQSTFTAGRSRVTSDVSLIDFNIELDEEYMILGANTVVVRFDPI